jgi:quercetin dioxygenase-like cupin family protein
MSDTPGSVPADALVDDRSGDGWTLVDGLLGAHPGTVPLAGDRPHQRRERAIPAVKKLGELEGVTAVRLAFRAGDVMADHSAVWPILIMGQSGRVEVTVAGPDNADLSGEDAATVELAPGAALNVTARRVHSLTATEASTVTLLVLHGGAEAPVSDSDE